MGKKYTCAGMNCGGRVKGYADGGSVRDIGQGMGSLAGGLAGGAAGVARRAASELATHSERLPYAKSVSQEVDEAQDRQRASDDRSRTGKPAYKRGGKVR